MLGLSNKADSFDFSILNHLPLGIIIRKLPTLEPIFLNVFMERLLGIGIDSLKGKSVEEQTHILFPLSSSEYERFLRFEKLVEPFKVLLNVKKEPPIWLECFSMFGVDGLGIEIFTDRTREIKLQHELHRKNQELELFSKILSHDIKGALFTLKGYISFISVSTLEQGLREIFEGISRSEKKLSRVVETCLQYYKTINTEVQLSKVDLKSLLSRVVSFFSEELEQINGKVRIVGGEEFVLGDEKLLETVFRNLLSNSIKFREPTRDLMVDIKSVQQDKTVKVYVTDNGKGIKPEQLPKLFQPFSRFHSEIEGTGLGLSLVKNILEKMGGSIDAQTNDIGVTFVLTLRKNEV